MEFRLFYKDFPLHNEGSVVIMKNNIVKVLRCCLQDRSESVLETLFSWSDCFRNAMWEVLVFPM